MRKVARQTALWCATFELHKTTPLRELRKWGCILQQKPVKIAVNIACEVNIEVNIPLMFTCCVDAIRHLASWVKNG